MEAPLVSPTSFQPSRYNGDGVGGRERECGPIVRVQTSKRMGENGGVAKRLGVDRLLADCRRT